MPATNMTPIDIAIASFADKDLKACASTTALAACECSSPELRTTLAQISQQAIGRQAQLAQMMNQKGIYVPPDADAQTISTLMPQLQAATQGLGVGNAAATAAVNPIGGVTAPRMV